MKPLLCEQPGEFAFEMLGHNGNLETAFSGCCEYGRGVWTAKISFQLEPAITVTSTAPYKHEAIAEALRRALLQQFDPPTKETLKNPV
jgi:hypothetical protein